MTYEELKTNMKKRKNIYLDFEFVTDEQKEEYLKKHYNRLNNVGLLEVMVRDFERRWKNELS